MLSIARLLSIISLLSFVKPIENLSLSSQQPLPRKSHTPLDVVRFQLSALQNDDMYTVFKYASPSNKAATGPWQRFGKMVRAEPYGILVGHDCAEVLLEWNVTGAESYRCIVRVWSTSSVRSGTNPITTATGSDSFQDEESLTTSKLGDQNLCTEFYWILSKCDERDDPLLKGCWMVDGVFPR